MTLTVDALTWNGVEIGGVDADVYLDEGVEGLGHVGVSAASVPRARGGSFGGLSLPGERIVAASCWLDVDATVDGTPALMAIYEAMAPRPDPSDELALAWVGLMWPAEHCVFARPTRCEWITDEDGTHGGAPGLDLAWVASDPTIYAYEQTTALTVASGSPVSTATAEAANEGILVPWARRAYEISLTAHGTVTNPTIRVDHADGSFERIAFPSLTMTNGQVLTLGADGYPRVGTTIVSARARSSWVGVTNSPDLRPLMLHPSDGEDGGNEITVSVASGTFSGTVKTRSTW